MKDQWEYMQLILIWLGACYKAKHNKLPVSSAVCLCVPDPSLLLSISESLLAWCELLERPELLWVRAPCPTPYPPLLFCTWTAFSMGPLFFLYFLLS